MDDSSESLQVKLALLAEQLTNQSPSVEETREIKTSIEEVLRHLAVVKDTL